MEKELLLTASEILFNAHSTNSIEKKEDSILGISFRLASFAPIIKYSENAYNELTTSDLFSKMESMKLKKLIHDYYGQIVFLNRYSESAKSFSQDLGDELAEFYEVIPAPDSGMKQISNFAGAAEENFTTIYDLDSFIARRSLNPKLYDMMDIHKDRLGGLDIIAKLRDGIIGEIDGILNDDN